MTIRHKILLGVALWSVALSALASAAESAIGDSSETEHWAALKAVPISEIETLPVVVAGTRLPIDKEQSAGLKSEFRRLATIFSAVTYSQYINALAYDSQRLNLSNYGQKLVSEFLGAAHPDRTRGSGDPLVDFEEYWNLYVRATNLKARFNGFCPAESSAELVDYSESEYVLLETLPYLKRLADTEENLGILASHSFAENGNELESLIALKKPITVAVCKVTLKTNLRDLAYPIVIRYFWSPTRHRWIQHDLYQLMGAAPVHLVL